ncbi:T9SS type B sorting domain-containing protein [Winogradskyella sp. DF17]|uniref:T9SS type B sorting domain-containing protein n=1 Tax=Winogradskyella pelagia TaxID=2819984 RepID=A0ABS3SZU5_9FLAO|nr:T9SS type B sorting domain-containing protein [Winogradskyella sp. DF17]MBO3116009.1 T9SS type B sorting domain-containing protein [Winogradskyella sp. DF17]
MKMFREIMCCVLLMSGLIQISFAQKEASNWYFGNNAGLNFNAAGTEALLDGQLQTGEGCATISNRQGGLLFYTDGITVWDRNHNITPNGTGLLGSPSSTQSAIIVPKPNNANIYYIFTAAAGGGDDGLNYSEVNMALNDGNGDITPLKNIQLLTPVPEKVTAIDHQNGNDYWVVSHEWETNRFFSYLVSNSGVSTTPVISAVGSVHGPDFRHALGYMKISPNGEKLALAKWNSDSDVELFDFDTATGVVSNPIELSGVFFDNPADTPPTGPYGLEFSPNSKVLYVSDWGSTLFQSYRVHQFDITQPTAADILASDTILYEVDFLIAALQLGIDGKLYVSVPGFSSLDVIENPNELGVNANYVVGGVDLGGRFPAAGLPPFIQSFFDVGIEFEGTCAGVETKFSINTNESIDSVAWDFGDGNTSTEISPEHIYLNPGTYDVTLNINIPGGTESFDERIIIYDTPIVTTVGDYVQCDDISGDGVEVFDLSTKTAEVLNGQSNALFDVEYFLSEEDALTTTNPLPLNFTNTESPQTIYALISNVENGSCNAVVAFDLRVNAIPVANPVTPLVLCDNEIPDGSESIELSQFDSVVLGGQSQDEFNVSYHLNPTDANNGANPMISPYQNISNPQTIYARIENSFNSQCFDTTPITIEISGQIIAFQPDDISSCDESGGDGIGQFNLVAQDEQIINNQTGNFNISYHLSQISADTGLDPLPAFFQNETNPQTIYARIEPAGNPFCYDTTSFEIAVVPLPDMVEDETATVCIGERLRLEADFGFDSYLWSTGETTRSIFVEEPGIYTVNIGSLSQTTPSVTCFVTKTFTVDASSEATILDIEIQDWTESNNEITVFVSGEGAYEYALDNGFYQDSNTFTGLLPNDYTVFVRDKNGCGVVSEDVFLLYYPKFFTPNGDSYNPTWQIANAALEPDLEVSIYDRYGKLITQFGSNSIGWDGTYNGQKMPTSDYWFVVKRPKTGATYTGHFTLKR